MISKSEVAAVARRKGWLAHLSPDLQTALLEIAHIVPAAAGTPLFNVGDPPGGMFGLISGCVAVEAAQSSRPPQMGMLLHAVAWFGEGALVGRSSRLVGIRATRPSTLLAIEIAGFQRVAKQFPDVWRHIAGLTVENQARAIGLAEDLMLRGSRERLSAIIVRLAGLRDPDPPAPPFVDATQADIAAIANLSRSVVSDLLPRMEREGLVALARGSVTILDPKRLLETI